MRPVLRGVLAAFACGAGFALACWALDRVVDPISAGGGRIEWVRDHSADYDTLFVGSSRTARQVVPSIFDAEMAEVGTPTRSFNLGMPGMRAPEDGYVAERALGRRATPLRYLVVECTPVRLGIPPGDRETARAVYWHDAARVRVLWNRIWAAQQVSHGGHLDERIVRRNLVEMLDPCATGDGTVAARAGADLVRGALSPADERTPALWLGPRRRLQPRLPAPAALRPRARALPARVEATTHDKHPHHARRRREPGRATPQARPRRALQRGGRAGGAADDGPYLRAGAGHRRPVPRLLRSEDAPRACSSSSIATTAAV